MTPIFNLYRLLITLFMIGFFCFSVSCSNDEAHSYDGKMVAVAKGKDIIMYGIDKRGNLSELGSASLRIDGLQVPHTIFGLTKHPNESIIYASSSNDCVDDDSDSHCWGNARIDKFSYTSQGNITHIGAAFVYDNESGPVCADYDWGYWDQTGACAPTTTVFSSDGSRLYVDDDCDDVIQIFSVDSITGNLTFLWESEEDGTRYDGLTISPDDRYLYNGSRVIEIADDTTATIVTGTPGNADEVVIDDKGRTFLISTLSGNTVSVFDLTNTSSPVLIDDIELDNASTSLIRTGSARYLSSSADLSRIIVVGAESVASIEFDGHSLALEDQEFDSNGNDEIMNRSVAITDDGSYALVAWFVPYISAGLRSMRGGLTLYQIPEYGSLKKVETIDFNAPSCAVLSIP